MLTLMCPKDSHKLCLYRPNNGHTWKKGVVHLKMLQYSDLSSLWHCLMYVLISILCALFELEDCLLAFVFSRNCCEDP